MRDEPDRLRWRTLVGYGALAVPLAALNLPLYVYLPTFYTTERGLGLDTVGWVLLAARLADVALDPLMGEAVDRGRGRLARRRAWVALSAPLLLLATWRLFVPPEPAGAVHLLTWSIVGYAAWTMMLLSYQAWGAELSADYHERSRVTAVREALVITGILLAAGLPAAIGAAPESAEALRLVFLAMLVTLPAALAMLLVLVPESAGPPPRGRAGFVAGLRLAARNRPFRRLILAFLLNGIANGLPATLFILFSRDVIGAAAWTGPFLLLYFTAGMAAVPAWLRLSRRVGKHRAWCGSMLWACAVFVWVPLLGEGDVAAFAVICVLSGLSLGADLALPASMQADVVDLDRLESGRRRTALFMAAWSMATKLALALAVGIAFPLLDLAGFTPGAPGSGSGLATLSALYALVPAGFKLVATALVWRFEIDADRQAWIQGEIERRQTG